MKRGTIEAVKTEAARLLEIASLQARIKTMAEEHADELMVAHLDGRMRAAQPAGVQQPGAAYAALPDADRDYMRKVVAVAVTMLFDGYKEDVTRVFSTGELSEFVTIAAAMGGERVEGIYRRAWDLLSLPVRASHEQAPAQAGAVPLTDEEVLDAFCRTPGIHQFVQAFWAGVRFAEQHHGIKGGQHGTE